MGEPLDDRCRQVLTDLAVYLDGECREDVATFVSTHLHACPPCLDRADFDRDLRALIAAKCRDAAPAGLVDRVLDALRGLGRA